MWHKGRSKGHWHFWKDSVEIFEPSKTRKKWKFEVRSYTGGKRSVSIEESDAKTLRLNRMLKRWIPEFNLFHP